jgi:hypothetical protein
MRKDYLIMANKYISDIIPSEDIQEWKLGDSILINAPTGSGKSYFTIEVLNIHAKATNNNILLITNRKLLKQQVEADIGKYSNITVYTYQQLTKILKANNFHNKYKYIVADECHFFFSDSDFNDETDITLEFLTNLKNNVVLFLSATCEVFKSYIIDKNKNIIFYGLDNQLIYRNLYYFIEAETVIRLLENIPESEKVIYFCSNTEYAYKLHKKFESISSFLCSDNKTNKFRKFISIDDRDNIIDNAKFSKQILFTTKILDNGVNIKDEQLKHIIIDLYDFDTIQQCIGRKRVLHDDDKVNVYIKKFKQNSIQSHLNFWNTIIKYGNEFMILDRQEYINQYGRKNTNSLIYLSQGKDGTILKLNEAYYYKLKYDVALFKQITENNKKSNDKFAHIQVLCDRYKIQLSEFKCLDDEITTDTFNDQLSKFLNIKMFKEEQSNFKEFIKTNAVKTVDKKHNSLGIHIINGYFDDNNIMYELKSFKETSGENKGKHYWQLFKLT